MVMTEHFRMERAGRYAFIATTIGVGKVIATHKQASNKWGTDPCIVGITDTGVAIVSRPEDGAIVTMYILSIGEAKKYFANALLPMVLEAVIRQNMRKGYHEMQNNF
jgi:hypothetical protein